MCPLISLRLNRNDNNKNIGLKPQGFSFFSAEKTTDFPDMSKTLFISYSHDSEQHKAWVKRFSDDLALLGDFEILLDQNMPKGFHLTRFMEKGIAVADKVLIIGTPQYKAKSEAGNGVAFEESIISTELLQDIDTLKYYPILRSGTFQTSFPLVLQGRNGDDMSDDNNYEASLQTIANEIINEKPIPSVFNQTSKSFTGDKEKIAEVYLSQDILVSTYYGVPTGNIEGISFSITVTNHAKEGRYYGGPLFELSVPIQGSANTFSMLNVISRPIHFPVKLEFGQQYKISYRLTPSNMEMFSSLLKKKIDAEIKVIVYTTLEEKVESNSILLSKIVENSKYV